MKKKIISLFCALSLVFTGFAWVIPTYASSANADNVTIPASDIPLKLWYDEEAPKINEGASHPDFDGKEDDGWQQWSLPIGNGYFGASVFGRTETERVQITEKTLGNKRMKISGSEKDVSYGGLNNFSETYIDFGHTNSAVSGYKRYLDMKTAISGVEYISGGVKYSREYFTSYPDKALVIRLDADTAGALTFTLRPTVPYEQEYMAVPGDGMGKTGEVTSSVTADGVGYIELSGKLKYYDVDFLGIYKVYTDGGTVTASTTTNDYGDTDGTIVVNGANSAYIVVTLGTDYELSSEMFTTSDNSKPTFNTDLSDARAKVEADMSAIDDKLSGKSYEEGYIALREAHVADHSALFGRATLDLACKEADFNITTDTLLTNYKNGTNKSTYLEVLLFQYGRYQLIASSREGALPANLQGVWNPYNTAPWGSGYWHNINIQMNYWPAFSTNLAETFKSYVDFNNAFMPKAESNATSNVNKYNPGMLDEDGGNGWVIGVGSFPFSVASDRSAGNLGFTTQMFWEYYQYTKDEEILKTVVLPKLLSAARYITKCVELDENGNYLVSYCDSPEVHVNGEWYYTKGTTYAQTFAYLNNYHALLLAKEAGIDLADEALLSTKEYSVLKTVLKQIKKYDPINVGLSGQIKEFREEDYYGSVGDDPSHRHVSQLVGLYPGNVINSNTPAWIDAALVTLDGRGENTTGGWVYSHKATLYARAKDGDGARERVDELLSRVTFPNLFTRLWEVYQIDASCGVTAGIAEMLLQSNAGYIEPLAALPSGWADGSYTGLCAEGNFEVSAKWENGIARTFNIKSKSGGTASVAYPTISNASVVRTSDGEAVNYTVDASDRIFFDTEVGETYIISGFSAQEKMSAPSSLSIDRKDVFGKFTLNWASVTKADSYNVYVALENSPTYTLLGNTKGTSFEYTASKENENARTTFAITAISSAGVESNRTLAYSNPIDTTASIVEAKAFILESGEAQFVINANSNAKKFRLYKKSASDASYTLVSESLTPVIRLADFDSKISYAVSALSYYDGAESEPFAITDFASYASDYNAENVFDGKTFVQNGTDSNFAAIGSSYGYDKLTDGILASSNNSAGRYSSKKETNTFASSANAIIDLEAEYFLDEITFYVFGSSAFVPQIGTNFTLEVFSNGKWVPIVANLKNVYADDYEEGEPSLSDYLVEIGGQYDKYHLVFDLNGIRASKLRFYSESIYKEGDGKYNYVTFWEVECSGVLVENIFENATNVLLNKEFKQESSAPSYSGTTKITPVAGYEYSMMTDGSYKGGKNEGRYSSVGGGGAYATVDLGGVYSLSEIKFYYFQKNFTKFAGTNYNIEVYYNGAWKTVVNRVGYEAILASNNNATDGYVFFDLAGVRAEKIRLFVEAQGSSNYVSFTEVECSGYCISEFQKQDGNILLGKEFESDLDTTTATIGGVYYEFPYSHLTDGKNYENKTAANGHTGRFSAKKAKPVDGTLDLGEIYAIDEIRFYYFNKLITTMGKNFTLEIYSDGVWKTIVDSISNEELASTYKHATSNYVVFNLNGMRAEKIRFSADAYDSSSTITLYEIEAFGSRILNRTYEDSCKNALSDATVIASGAENTASVNDGRLDSFISGTSGNGSFSVEMHFNSTKLFTLGIHEQVSGATASDDTKVEIYRDGVWLTVYAGITLSDSGYTELNLYGINCSGLRITFNDTKGEGNAKISEITCTPGKPNAPDRAPLIEVYDKLKGLDITTDEHKAKMEEFRMVLTSFTLQESEIAPCRAEMSAYYLELIKGSINYTPKTSITLGSELVLNVYLPEKGLQSFTLDGVNYTDAEISTLEEVIISDAKYYRIALPIMPYEGAREIELTVVIGDVEASIPSATGRFTLSIPKYATKVLDSGSSVEKTLIKDTLSYIRSAYAYFSPSDSADETALIDSIIGTDYDAISDYKPEGAINTVTGLAGATFYIEEAPAFRFYLHSNDDASKYSFKINGSAVNATEGADSDGQYLEVKVYAYMLCETVTIYKDNLEIGSYHIASYHNWASGQDDPALLAFVERLWKYCQSARDYKNSVAVSIEYLDDGGNELADTYSNRFASGEEFSIKSPAIAGYYTEDLYVIASASKDTVFTVIYKKIPTNLNTDTVSGLLPDLAAWGDSITMGSGGSDINAATEHSIDLVSLGGTAAGANYVNVLKNLIAANVYGNIDVANCGVAGETTATIASRANTETYYLYLDDAVSIGGEAVKIPLTHYASQDRIGILRQGNGNPINPVTISGKDINGNDVSVIGNIAISLTADAPAGTDIRTCDYSYIEYTFTRTDGGADTVSFASGAKVITAPSYLYDGRTVIIFMGENGGYSNLDELIAQQEEILEACGNPEMFLIISSTSGSNESRKEITEVMTERWGERYINMGNELNSSTKSYELAGYSEEAIASATESIANGTVNQLLIKDKCHPNAVGYAVIGNIIFERLFRLGSFDDLFEYYSSLNS